MSEAPDLGQRLADFRAELQRGGLTGFIVPHADEHQSEYLPASAERLAWLTGFTGSAGTAIVLANEAAIFVDGRYTLQVGSQINEALFAPQHLIDTPPPEWLKEHTGEGDRIGYDPWLMTIAEVGRFEKACVETGAELVAIDSNPIDAVWTDRPDPPLGAISLQSDDLAGEPADAKLARLAEALDEAKADATVLGLADAVAWTFNLRGTDIAHNPVALAWAILRRDGKPTLFVDSRKLSNAVRSALAEHADIETPDALPQALAELGSAGARVLLEPRSMAAAVAAAVTDAGGTVVEGADPTALPKARKNATEIAGARRAHIRDGAAMVRFLAWLDATVGSGTVDEVLAAEKLAGFRAETALADGSELADLSFGTISGAGPDGAIVHYQVSPETNRKLEPGTLYLVDSGAQYRDGTTDLTRTVAVGEPTDEMRDRFTRVLKGMVAVATARFPAGTNGIQLDAFARRALWDAGLDYDHGTGHGVGSFLSVHEGPANLSKRGTIALEPGMVLSDEPGYYKTGAYGIRIENLVLVTNAEAIPGGDRPMLGFETLTLCPIDRRLIDPRLLTIAELDWIDDYHARLPDALGHLLDEDERTWLAAATRPLS
ncbi:aminopeptidase P family protein [Bauldia sp.]|uniref:aminopeptidase P family protein n=1 Tax=Bauldia sp. TaxID=2575872 RepID=UPI003BAD4E8F